MEPLRGWAPKGQRLQPKVPFGHWMSNSAEFSMLIYTLSKLGSGSNGAESTFQPACGAYGRRFRPYPATNNPFRQFPKRTFTRAASGQLRG